MLNLHHPGPGALYPVWKHPAIANRCFTDRCLCGSFCLKACYFCHDFGRVPLRKDVSWYNRRLDRLSDLKQWMDYEWLLLCSVWGNAEFTFEQEIVFIISVGHCREAAPSCSPSRGREIRWWCINNSVWEEKNQMNIKDTQCTSAAAAVTHRRKSDLLGLH